MKNEKIIIIGGGVGPAAGTLLHNYIIRNTLTNGTDQDHLDLYHFSRSGDIPDRTMALKNGNTLEPAEGMLRTFRIAQASINKAGREAVGGIPCNTFHAPEIFNLFLDKLKDSEIEIPIINMIDETIRSITELFPDVRKIGLLSTTGTRETKLYSKKLRKLGLETVEVSESIQKELHDSIYNKTWGIKAVSPVSLKAKTNFQRYADDLLNRGAEVIILGCTEIPLALPEKQYRGITLIDPMVSLARALIREANPSKLK